MVSAPYERKNKKPENIAVRAVKAYISKSILPTYGRFSRGRSHISTVILYRPDHFCCDRPKHFLLHPPLPSSPIGPTIQTDVVKSAASINMIITFDNFINLIFVEFNITNDDVALEPVEMYTVQLAPVGNDSRIMILSPKVITVNIVDDDSNGSSYISLLLQTYKHTHTETCTYTLCTSHGSILSILSCSL